MYLLCTHTCVCVHTHTPVNCRLDPHTHSCIVPYFPLTSMMYICLHTYTKNICIHVHAYMYVYMYIHICVCVCMYIYSCKLSSWPKCARVPSWHLWRGPHLQKQVCKCVSLYVCVCILCLSSPSEYISAFSVRPSPPFSPPHPHPSPSVNPPPPPPPLCVARMDRMVRIYKVLKVSKKSRKYGKEGWGYKAWYAGVDNNSI